ncbi:MAG: lytic transglycosylase [Deltaproteobacteria bacterium]|nr:MAG: lytic transglycosylase [Deltaproteobacteria bacterium]
MTVYKSNILFCLFVFFFSVKGYEAQAAEDFTRFLENFYPRAAREGITRQTWDKAFAGVEEPDRRVLEKAAYQPEFTLKIWSYLDARVNSATVAKGREYAEKYRTTLQAISAKFGVRPSILLALWSMESSYGEALQKTERFHYVPLALATLAYADPKRKKFGSSQLIAALKILQAGDVRADRFLGSWAGAMGHTQFIPTSYLAYGVDMNGDGRRDIWHSVADALATAANLLRKNGWRTGKTWGYEVIVPQKKRALEGQEKTLRQWQALGVYRPDGKAYAWPDDRAVLKFFAGPQGPAFLVMKNFYIIKRYNNSDFYALAVGLLADEIAGYGSKTLQWPRPQGSLTFDEILEVQRLLKQAGFYTGEVDGQPGPRSRQAILLFQRSLGLEETGEATVPVLISLRQQRGRAE